jgi:hypothetical protein
VTGTHTLPALSGLGCDPGSAPVAGDPAATGPDAIDALTRMA